MKKQLGPSNAMFPVPAALIVTASGEETNIITIAGIAVVSSTPLTLGITLSKSRYSLELMRKSKEFTVNIPCADYVNEVDYCGITSGRKVNKFADTGLTAVNSIKVGVPIIDECPYNIECRLVREIDLGDWVFVLGEILETHIDEDKYDESSKAHIAIAKVNALVYCSKAREYWSMGQKLADGFSAGKTLLKTNPK
jgi:flavin reductase (DIM6/NTAB) family NADH-FMN oxidoreductase RutF